MAIHIPIIIKMVFFCFDMETYVKKRNGDIVKVIDLVVGDEIMTSESNEDSFTAVLLLCMDLLMLISLLWKMVRQ